MTNNTDNVAEALKAEFTEHIIDASLPFRDEKERDNYAERLRQTVCQRMVERLAQEICDRILGEAEADDEDDTTETPTDPPGPLKEGDVPPPTGV